MRRTFLAPLLACLALASACSGESRNEAAYATGEDAATISAPAEPQAPDALSRRAA